MVLDLRGFLDRLDSLGDLKRVSHAGLRYEIGAIPEIERRSRAPFRSH